MAWAGSAAARPRLPWDKQRLIGIGVLVAVFTGIASWFVGFPFLTTSYTYVTLPVVGKFELASALLFDLGVFLAVVGTVLVILTRIGALSPREEAL